MRGRLGITMMIVVGVLAAPAPGGGTLHVRDDAPFGGDGLTWETAYRALQSALTHAREAPGTVAEIRVAGGVYEPDQTAAFPLGTGDREATFDLVDGVTLLGGYAGDGPDPDARDLVENETVLSGDLDRDDGPDFTNYGDNAYLIVRVQGQDVSVTIDGFTIGGANGRDDFEYGDGGMANWADATITRCTFIANRAYSGGGLGGYYDRGTIRACAFIGNRAKVGGGYHGISFGTVMTDCTFRDNEAEWSGGGAYVNVGVWIDRATFVGNTADHGGGAWLWVNAAPLGGTPLISNAVFVANSAGRGGGVSLSLDGRIENCTFVGNTATEGASAIAYDGDLPFTEAVNCIVHGNDEPQVEAFGQYHDYDIDLTYSIVEGGFPGEGNLDVDPRLTNGYRLRPGSPAIDAGRSAALGPDVTADYHGDPRFHDDPGTPDTGVPDGRGPVDIGATEFQGTTCLADIDANGVADFDDLLLVLSAWGPCPPLDPCEEDVDRSGAVDFDDLLIVLSGWGPCP